MIQRGKVTNDCFSHCSALDRVVPNRMLNSRQGQRNGCPTMWPDWAQEIQYSLIFCWNYWQETFTLSIWVICFLESLNALKKIRTSVGYDSTCLSSHFKIERQPGLCSKFKTSQGYIMRTKTKYNTTKVKPKAILRKMKQKLVFCLPARSVTKSSC